MSFNCSDEIFLPVLNSSIPPLPCLFSQETCTCLPLCLYNHSYICLDGLIFQGPVQVALLAMSIHFPISMNFLLLGFPLHFLCSSIRKLITVSLVYHIVYMCPSSLLHCQLLWDKLYLFTLAHIPVPFPQHVTEYLVQSRCSEFFLNLNLLESTSEE